MIIYKATNLVNGKVYIGLTTRTFEERKAHHLWDAFKSDSKVIFHKALRKYGKDNFIWDIIDTADTQSELNEKEMEWISFYNSYGENGYNMTRGGEGASGFKVSKETKKKMSEIQKRNPSIRGSNHGSAKLTENDVFKIKELLKEGVTSREIAKMFNVKEVTIGFIKTGRTWKHIGEDLSMLCKKKLTHSEIIEIKDLLKHGALSQKEIAEVYGASPTTITEIKTGKTAKNIGEDLQMSSISISEESVKEIKLLLAEGNLSQHEIAVKFNISEGSVSNIKTGKTWSHLSVEGFTIDRSKTNAKRLTVEEVIEIKSLLKKGNLHSDIAEKFNVSTTAISRINRGIRWRHITV